MTERMKENMNISMDNEIAGIERAGSPSYREQLFEVLTFCFLILPGLAFSFTAGPALKENFLLGVSGVMLSDLALVTLVCFFLWHNGEKFSRIGWVSKGYVTEIIIGVLLYLPLSTVCLLLKSGFNRQDCLFRKDISPRSWNRRGQLSR